MLHCRAGRCAASSGRCRKWAPRSPPAPGDRPPVIIRGGDLAGIQFAPETPSAQVKSAVLLAGLQASGETVGHRARLYSRSYGTGAGGVRRRRSTVDGPAASRLQGGQRLHGLRADACPGDISSAAFMAVAAAALPGSDVIDHARRPEPQPRGAARRAEAIRRRRRGDRRRRSGMASRSAACGFVTARCATS